ncbi:MAG: hypothetical protein NXI24_09345 [bacterium]|nr:hypothetical protein [bacterium]
MNRPSPFQAAQQKPAAGHAGYQRGAPTVEAAPTGLKRRNRSLVLVLSLLILAFTVGMMAGIQLGYLRHVDATLVKNPDPGSESEVAKRDGTTSFANTGTESSISSPEAREGLRDHMDGRYLVRVGSFAPRAAELLAGRLNNHPDLAQQKPVQCKNVRESRPDRYLAFRVKLGDGSDRQNVFLGCFRSQDAAREALDKAIASGIPGLSAARLFEIE